MNWDSRFDKIDSRLEKIESKLDSHLERIAKTEIWIKGHATIIGFIVTTVVALAIRLFFGGN